MIPGDSGLGESSVAAPFGGPALATVSPYAAMMADDPVERVFLVIMYPVNRSTGTETPIYASTNSFRTEAGDTPAKTLFPGVLDNPYNYGASISERNFLTGKANVSGTTIVLDNSDALNDSIKDLVFPGYTIEVYVGGVDFTFSEFECRFRGTMKNITWDDRSFAVYIQDQEAILDLPLQTTKYAGTGGNEGGADLKGKEKPVCYGYNPNIEPVLVDASSSLYQWHYRASQEVVEVRFAGVPKVEGTDYTLDMTNSRMTLLTSPNGRVTMDVRGDASGSGYVSTAADIAERMLVDDGGLATTDLYLYSFQQVNNRNTAEVGIYVGAVPSNVTTQLDILMRSVGGMYEVNRLNQVTLRIIDSIPAASKTLSDNDIKEGSFKRIDTPEPTYRTKVGYDELGVVQGRDELAGAVSEAEQAYYQEKIRYITDEDLSIQTDHPLAKERILDTRMKESSDATALGDKQQTFHGTARDIYEFVVPHLTFDLELGMTVSVTYPRYGFDSGRTGVLIGFSENARFDEAEYKVMF